MGESPDGWVMFRVDKVRNVLDEWVMFGVGRVNNVRDKWSRR